MKECNKCGSTNIVASDKKMKKICKPKTANTHPNRKVTYGYCYYEYTCECGYTWQEETNL
jgi:hypothetical protein